MTLKDTDTLKSQEFQLQPVLKNEIVTIQPLQQSDYAAVYKLASDPLVWEQHPQKDRYKKEVFDKYFESAIESKGAFLVTSSKTGEPAGCTRYYDLYKEPDSVAIGYTFLSRDFWGGTYNSALKSLMIEHAFRFVNKIIFHVGVNNMRSQKAVEKLGAINVGEMDLEYTSGSGLNRNIVYELTPERWREATQSQ